MKRKVDDYIATRTTLRGPAEIGPISVKQLFIDQFLHRQSDKLQAFSSNGRHLYIMANGEEIFDLNSWMQDFEMIQVKYLLSISRHTVVHSRTNSTPRGIRLQCN